MELVLVLSIVGILVALVPVAVFQGVRAFLFIPKSQTASHAAMEILQVAIEGGYAEGPQQTIRGLRFAARGTAPIAVWFATATSVAYMTSTNERVLLRLDAGRIKRSLLPNLTCPPAIPAQEDVVPYYAAGTVSIQTPTPPLFRYYNVSGASIAPTANGCRTGADPIIRRIDMALTAQTGNGSFDQSDASVAVQSSVAIRFP